MVTIAFDIDDVLADMVPVWLTRYNQLYEDTLTIADMTRWDISQLVKKQCGSKIYDLLTPDLYDDVPVLPGAHEAVEMARSIGRVLFVTSAHPLHAGRKFRWLNDNGFDVDIKDYIECRDKTLIKADVLFDDRAATLYAFDGMRCIITKPWNVTVKLYPSYRLQNLEDAALIDVWAAIAQLDAPSNTAIKYDQDKPRMELLSQWVLEDVAKVMTYGANKYSENNWRNGFRWTRPIGACLRHVGAWLRGTNTDEESGLPHLAHAICCLMFTHEHQMLNMGTDDRWRPPVS